jgi:hypothetical protein
LGIYSHAEGVYTTAKNPYSHAEGCGTTAGSDDNDSDEFSYNTYDGTCYDEDGFSRRSQHAEGEYTIALHGASHTEGCYTMAIGLCSHAEGAGCEYEIGPESSLNLSGDYAYSKAVGDYSHVEGFHNLAADYQHVQGHFNEWKSGGHHYGVYGTAFIIGNGTYDGSTKEITNSNAFRVTYKGETYAQAAYSATGADYAEYFEWLDGNPDNEDRRGKFVTMDGKKITFAKEGDWVLGIVSANPCVLGNTDTEWQGKFMKDEFGSYIKEKSIQTIKLPKKVTDANGNVTFEKIDQEVEFYKVNPDYDPDKEYVQRDDRPEWSAIGMLGVLAVYDDGTCEVNGFCKCNNNSIATKSDTGYRVIERVTDNIVRIVFSVR